MSAHSDAGLLPLVEPLRARLREQGLTHGQLAIRLGCDRSRVSRALSAHELPPRHLLVQIAEALGLDAEAAQRDWVALKLRIGSTRARAELIAAGGGPPPSIASHRDLLQALRGLLVVQGISQRELARRGRLHRSTIGAVLRGDQSTHLWLILTIVRVCGVSEAAEAAWADVWMRYGKPHQQERYRRRREGYERMLWLEAW